MPKKSAGILLYRTKDQVLELFLVHPGGPLHVKRDAGAWSVPKGEFLDDEDPLTAAKREFKEETSVEVQGSFIELAPVKQKSGKIVYAWALQGDLDEQQLVSNLFTMQWPPRSGRYQSFPEIDRGEWFSVQTARQKIIPAQAAFIDELVRILHQ